MEWTVRDKGNLEQKFTVGVKSWRGGLASTNPFMVGEGDGSALM